MDLSSRPDPGNERDQQDDRELGHNRLRKKPPAEGIFIQFL